MFTVDQHLHAIEKTLAQHTAPLIHTLQKVAGYSFSPKIDLLDFSAFIEPTRFELSIQLFSMDREANEVFPDGDTSTFAGSEEVLAETGYYEMQDAHRDDFDAFYDQHEETLLPQEEALIKDWFKACWQQAGLAALPIPSYFTFHGHPQSFDLKNDRWIDSEDMWQQERRSE